MKLKFFIFFLLIFYGSELKAQHYYWHKANKYEIAPIHSKSFVLIDTDSCNTKEYLASYGLQIHQINKTKIPNRAGDNKAYHWAYAKNNAQSIKALEQVLYAAPGFKVGRDTLFISNFFYIKLKRLEDVALLEEIAKETNSVIVKQNNFMPNWWVLSAEGNKNTNALELANEFYESGLFAAAQPDFMVKPTRACTNDTHFGQQWALKNTGQNGGTAGIDIKACEAWAINDGGCSNITVAVFDSGIEASHDDINTVIASFDVETDTMPSYIYDNHGTKVGGIIAAEHSNQTGVAGVSSEVGIIDISWDETGAGLLEAQKMANGINFAWENGADVINNSWTIHFIPSYQEIVDDAIENAITLGRNGLGTVIIAASGNAHDSIVKYPANHPEVIAVGAINNKGERPIFSTYGEGLSLVAPGVGIYTTDLNNSYAFDDGTSLAAPMVSGAAALILSELPELTHTEVREILESTATKLPAYSFTMGAGSKPNLTWNDEVGYGLLNMEAALNAVKNYVKISQKPTFLCNSPSYVFTLSKNFALADVTWEVSDPSLIEIVSSNNESVTVKASSSTVSGTGWVKATITYDCSSFTAKTGNFWVGLPEAVLSPMTQVGQLNGDCIPKQTIYDISCEVLTVPGATDVQWRTFPVHSGIDLTWGYNGLGIHVVVYAHHNVPAGCYDLYVEPVNDCGMSLGTAFTQIEITDYTSCNSCMGGGPMFVSYPNPVDDELTISLNEEGKQLLQQDRAFEYQVTINDEFGKLVYDRCHHEENAKVNMRGLKRGYYRLLITYKGEQYSYKIEKR